MSTETDLKEVIASHLKRLGEINISRVLTDEASRKLAEGLSDLVKVAEEGDAGELPRVPRMPTEDGSLDTLMPTSPITGRYHSFAPSITLQAKDGVVTGRVTFTKLHEGPPRCVHGGILALLFDMALGLTAGLNEGPAMTGTLTIKYLKPTPLFKELSVKAWKKGSEGRKVFLEGEVECEGTVTARAEGIWVKVDIQSYLESLFGKQG